jgi:hypothetical protein
MELAAHHVSASLVSKREPDGRCHDQIERLLPKKRQAWNKTPL